MSFGWAYINCSSSVASDVNVGGPTGSIQFLHSTDCLSGSANLMYYTASHGAYSPSTLVLTGTLVVSGTLSASSMHIENVIEIDSSGSTYFGNTDDDIHARTGSLIMTTAEPSTYMSTSTSTKQTYMQAMRWGYQSVDTINYTSSVSSSVLGVNAAADVHVRIHSASIAGSGAILVIKDELISRGAINSIYISASAPNKIDGADYTEMVGGSMPSINLYSNGANWFIF
jgi:hypothetical protein